MKFIPGKLSSYSFFAPCRFIQFSQEKNYSEIEKRISDKGEDKGRDKKKIKKQPSVEIHFPFMSGEHSFVVNMRRDTNNICGKLQIKPGQS